jgi:hypothetical protein
MKQLACLLVATGIATGLGAAHAATRATGPVVVELFTAQGCASCKAANRLIAQLADRPGVIVLTWTVDYWDYLGWKDTFAEPEFTARQRAYDRHLGPRDVYTPQVIVDGASQVSGDDAQAVEALIQRAEHPAGRRGGGRRPRVRILAGGLVRVGRGHRPAGHGPSARADVWLVRYDPREQDVTVTAGDNHGATVVQRNVVREMIRLGAWSGRQITFHAPPPRDDTLASAVLVQAPRGGPVLAAEAPRPGRM